MLRNYEISYPEKINRKSLKVATVPDPCNTGEGIVSLKSRFYICAFLLCFFSSPCFAQKTADTINYHHILKFTPDCFGIFHLDTLMSPGYFVLTDTHFCYRKIKVRTFDKKGHATGNWIRTADNYQVRYLNVIYRFIL